MEGMLAAIDSFFSDTMPGTLVLAALILLATAIISHLCTKLIRHVIQLDGVPLPSSSILVNIARIAIWSIGIGTMLSVCFHVDVNALIAALGVGGLALSLGLQDTIKNFIGGLQVTIMKLAQPGDHITVSGVDGIVQDVNWRQTVVKDYENKLHIIPNAIMSSAELGQVKPEYLVSSTVVLNNDGRDIDAMLSEMELLAKEAVSKVAKLEKDPWLLVTQIGEYGIWTSMRFVLDGPEHAREARDAALRAIAPYTRNNSADILEPACD